MVLSEEGDAALLNQSRNPITLDMPAPLLVIEVVSPNDPARDYRYKRSEYAVRGILEYWIVDPDKKQISVLTLREGFYDDDVLRGEQSIASLALPDFRLTVHQILLEHPV